MRKKDRRFELEGIISTMVFDRNRSTVHFDYHVDIDDVDNSVELDLYTRNARNGAIFLLHQTRGTSSISALEKMVEYLADHSPGGEKNSYTVRWVDIRDKDAAEHVSYFYEKNEQEVLRKFFYNRKEKDFRINLELNPLS
jgi:hypothetical protein